MARCVVCDQDSCDHIPRPEHHDQRSFHCPRCGWYHMERDLHSQLVQARREETKDILQLLPGLARAIATSTMIPTFTLANWGAEARAHLGLQ
jgi:hypothetical protein